MLEQRQLYVERQLVDGCILGPHVCVMLCDGSQISRNSDFSTNSARNEMRFRGVNKPTMGNQNI